MIHSICLALHFKRLNVHGEKVLVVLGANVAACLMLLALIADKYCKHQFFKQQ